MCVGFAGEWICVKGPVTAVVIRQQVIAIGTSPLEVFGGMRSRPTDSRLLTVDTDWQAGLEK